MSDQSVPPGWSSQPSLQSSIPGAPAAPGAAHPLLWARMPAEMASPPVPRSPEEALAMMERSHAATIALLPEDTDADAEETTPLTRAWFDGVRDACARTGRVPGVERMLFEWWLDDPPIPGLSQLPWLFGVWQGHWICWAGTTPWAAADLAAKSTFDAVRVAVGVQFGADPEHPPATPWPPFGTAAMAVPTTILLALSGQPAPKQRLIPVTPVFVAPAPPPPPPPPPAPAPVLAASPTAEAVDPIATDPEVPAADDAAAIDADGPAAADSVDGDDALTVPAGNPGAETATEAEGASLPSEEEADAPDSSTALASEPGPDAPGDAGVGNEPTAPEPEPEPVAQVAPIEPAPTLPPAGWFPDPAGRHALRYWDGKEWTAHAADPGSDTLHDPI